MVINLWKREKKNIIIIIWDKQCKKYRYATTLPGCRAACYVDFGSNSAPAATALGAQPQPRVLSLAPECHLRCQAVVARIVTVAHCPALLLASPPSNLAV